MTGVPAIPDLACPHCGGRFRLRRGPAGQPALPASAQSAPDTLAGPDGPVISRLLAPLQQLGIQAIRQAAQPAVERALSGQRISAQLFAPEERDTLTAALAANLAASELLGRAFIRLRQQAAQQGGTRLFAEGDGRAKRRDLLDRITDFLGVLFIRTPRAILNFFHALFPSIAVEEVPFVTRVEQTARERVQQTEEVLAGRLTDKLPDLDPAATVEEVLDQVGVGPTNDSYGKLVIEVNDQGEYHRGGSEEHQQPDVAALLPFWVYNAVERPTSRPHHLARLGNIYPADQRFEDVRGHGPEEEANCLCSYTPITAQQAQILRSGPTGTGKFAEAPPRPPRAIAPAPPVIHVHAPAPVIPPLPPAPAQPPATVYVYADPPVTDPTIGETLRGIKELLERPQPAPVFQVPLAPAPVAALPAPEYDVVHDHENGALVRSRRVPKGEGAPVMPSPEPEYDVVHDYDPKTQKLIRSRRVPRGET